MFNNKKESLFEVPVKEGTKNSFIQEGLKSSAITVSGNGALKYDSTGNSFVDQFGSVGQFLPARDYNTIEKDISLLYAQDKETAIKFTLYLRLISRKCSLFDGTKTETVQRGAGLKYESIMRMVWLQKNDEEAFWQNIQLFIACGSWKDVFEMLRVDLEYHGFEKRVLNWDKFANLILAGLENENTSELVKKYLPQITAKSKCDTLRKQANTIIGKFISNKLFGKNAYKEYRKLKSSGKAHTWQQLISKKLFSQINFDTVHGRALSSLVSSKFLANHNLEGVYTEWIESKPVAKYTGYVHELASKIGSPNMCGWRSKARELTAYQKMTINKQYSGLVELARTDVNVKSGLIVVRDTSSSMTSNAKGLDMSSFDVAKALGIFFGDMLDGHFKNTWIEFADNAKLHTYKTKTFVDKWLEDSSEAYGSTNFQAVVDLFISIKRSGVKESEFPTGILCISDGELNSSSLNRTNVEDARLKLSNAGFSDDYVENFQIVMWNIPNGYYRDSSTKFETFGETENVFYLSGYDGSIISFLLGGTTNTSAPKTDVELFNEAMNQEVLNMVRV